MIAVQTITTNWTKASRGRELATLRNRVPRQLPLRLPPGRPVLVWHDVLFSERNRFAGPFSEAVKTSAEDDRFGCSNVEIAIHHDAATLTYRYQTGAPARAFFAKTGEFRPPEHAITIQLNQWASVEYNGRLTSISTGDWWYEHVVVNVAVAESISPDVFIATEPIERYRQLAKLW